MAEPTARTPHRSRSALLASRTHATSFRHHRTWHCSCTTHRRCEPAQTEAVMRVLVVVSTIAVLSVASPLLAQERPVSDPKAFVSASGGFVSALGDKTSDVRFEGGVRIAPHLMIFGNVGKFGDLQTDLQPQID